MTESLEKLRTEIDEIDDLIIELLNKRATVAVKIGEIKAAKGDALYVPSRERKILLRLIEKNHGPVSNVSVDKIFNEIMAASLALEHHGKILCGGADEELLNRAVRYITGNNEDVEIIEDPEVLLAAIGEAEADVLAVVRDGWLDLGEQPEFIAWAGSWRVNGSEELFNVYRRMDAPLRQDKPVILYCLLERTDLMVPEWVKSIPARAVEVLPMIDNGRTMILKIRLELDDPEKVVELTEEILSNCSGVWLG